MTGENACPPIRFGRRKCQSSCSVRQAKMPVLLFGSTGGNACPPGYLASRNASYIATRFSEGVFACTL
jgi:hypothetical protein